MSFNWDWGHAELPAKTRESPSCNLGQKLTMTRLLNILLLSVMRQ
jgi:hypothetical protein